MLPAGWLPRTEISSETLRSVIEYGLPLPFTIKQAAWYRWQWTWTAQWLGPRLNSCLLGRSGAVHLAHISLNYFPQQPRKFTGNHWWHLKRSGTQMAGTGWSETFSFKTHLAFFSHAQNSRHKATALSHYYLSSISLSPKSLWLWLVGLGPQSSGQLCHWKTELHESKEHTYSHRPFLAACPMTCNSLPDFMWDPTSSTDSFRCLLKTYLSA